ncbi:MAG: AAA family ATPase [Christiangramia sp.]|nr:AAA family ATPase [Christiangramia sp.]
MPHSPENNVKLEFANWLLKNSPPSYKTYLGSTKDSVLGKLEEIDSFFSDISFFDIDKRDLNNSISKIEQVLSKNGRKKYPQFDEYNQKRGSGIPRAVMGRENYLKFLKNHFKNVKETSYWIFQGNPEIYDIEKALRAGHLKSWKVAAHKDKIKPGDKVILWQTGEKAGCYALAEVISEVGIIEEENFEKQYYRIKNSQDNTERVKIRVTDNFGDNPVLWSAIKDLPGFSNFKAGNQGTNFSASRSEYEEIEAIGKLRNDYKIFVLFKIYLQDVKGPSDQTKENYLNTVFQKIPQLWQYKYEEPFLPFKINIDNLKKLKTLTFGDFNGNFSGKLHFRSFIEQLMMKMNNNDQEKDEIKVLNLNRILYGPPGTGKTFQLQDTYFEEFTVQETSLNREQYLENIVSDLKWWQAAAIALLDLKRSKVTDIVSHELLRIKTKLSNSKNPNATLWGYLQHYTVPECEFVKVATRSSNPIFYKDENSVWEVKEELLEQFYPEAYSILEEVKNYHPNPDKFIKNYEFVTFHQSFSYEDFIEGIKPNLDEEENNVSYRIEDGIFKKMCLKADADRENRYALFIDEINRGNVSSIFGELITLIEDDKRLGEENELRVKLPYSKTDLGVPPNLHIIGTMNTADRSVEALDTALRRRFVFEEIMPQPELLRNIEFDGFNLGELLSTINERIEALLDRDHTIGHSYFIKINSGDTEALQEAFENKIIPLLQEYFYHDYEKVALILGSGFVERKEGKVSFAKFPKLDLPEVLPSYHLKEVENIESAVRILLNREDEAGE